MILINMSSLSHFGQVMHAHCRVPVEGSGEKAARKVSLIFFFPTDILGLGVLGVLTCFSQCLLAPDVQAIVSDFKLMGEGLVKSVQILSDPPSNT